MAPPPLPTSVLLSRALAACSWSFDERTGVGESLPLWANVLQYVEDEIDVRALPPRSCLSRRASLTGCKRLARSGLAELRDKTLMLTPAGAAARDGWRPWVSELGGAWPEASALRSSLVAIVGALPLEHPHFPTQYGTADSSITGGPGQDWKPVRREGDGGEGGLPLVALLSQAFVALAIAYEPRNGALGWVANVMAFVPDEGVAVGDLPPAGRRLLGGLERHGWIAVDAGAKRVTPTAFGRVRRTAHEPTLAAIDAEWCQQFGADVVESLRTSLQACVAALPFGELVKVFHAPTAALFGYGHGGRAAP